MPQSRLLHLVQCDESGPQICDGRFQSMKDRSPDPATEFFRTTCRQNAGALWLIDG
jgi:hypothetical protein